MRRDATTEPWSPDHPPGLRPGPRRRRHTLRWVRTGLTLVLLAGAGTFAYLWSHSGAHAVPSSVAIRRFLQEGGAGKDKQGGGPATRALLVPRDVAHDGVDGIAGRHLDARCARGLHARLADAPARAGSQRRYSFAAFSPRILRCTSGVNVDIFSATVSSGLG